MPAHLERDALPAVFSGLERLEQVRRQALQLLVGELENSVLLIQVLAKLEANPADLILALAHALAPRLVQVQAVAPRITQRVLKKAAVSTG